MPNTPKPIPLNYARPTTPTPDDSPSPQHPTATRGTLPPDEPATPILDTPDRAGMSFAARALDQHRIPYRITELPAPAGSYSGPLRLHVRPPDADRASALAHQIIARRERAKQLNPPPRHSPSTWPDPLSPPSF